MRRTHSLILVHSMVALAVALAGCASYHARPLSPAESAAALQERSLADARLQAFIAAVLPVPDAVLAERAPDSAEPAAGRGTTTLPRSWDVTALTLAALYFHPDLDIARARLAQAEASLRAAREIPNPTVSFEDLSYAPRGVGASQWTLAPVINFLIETAGRRGKRSSAASALLEAARADLHTVSWQVRGSVRDALLVLWANEGRLQLLRQRLALESELATLLEHRLAVGEASALELARERTNRNQARLAAGDAEREQQLARAELAAAIGISLRALDDAELSFRGFEAPVPPADDSALQELRRRALLGRSDLQSLLAQYAAAESALALEVAAQYPNITLGPGYSFDSAQNRYLLLPAFELPLFNHNQARIAASIAAREAAAAHFTALQARILDTIDGASLAYRACARSLASADALLDGEQERENRTLRSFESGAIDRPTLLAARLERLAAAQSRFETLVQQRRSVAALEDALQHPFFGPELPAPSELSPRAATREDTRR